MGREVQLFFLLMLSSSLVVFCSANDGPASDTVVESSSEDGILDLLELSPQEKNLNQIVDFLIQIAQINIQKKGKATVEIPDIEEEFTKSFHSINITGTFKTEHGWVRDLSSVHRTGNATLSDDNGNLTISVALGLETLQLGYDQFRVKIKPFIKASGKLKAEVESNSILVKLNLIMLDSGKCNVTLHDLKIELDGLKLHVEGKVKPMSMLISKVATSIANRKKNKIVDQIVKKIREPIQKALNKYHC